MNVLPLEDTTSSVPVKLVNVSVATVWVPFFKVSISLPFDSVISLLVNVVPTNSITSEWLESAWVPENPAIFAPNCDALWRTSSP